MEVLGEPCASFREIKTITSKLTVFTLYYFIIAGSLESAYSLIWGSHKIWGKGGGETLDLL